MVLGNDVTEMGTVSPRWLSFNPRGLIEELPNSSGLIELLSPNPVA